MISDSQYLTWQKKLANSSMFRRFWLFWGIYGVVIFAVLGIIVLVLYKNWQVVVMATVAAVFNRYVVCELIDLVYKKPHPYQRLNFIPPTSVLFSFKDARHDAFPSEHESTAIAIAAVFLFYYPVLGLIAFISAIIIGLGRIVLGYHEITDVLAGLGVGLLSSSAAIYFLVTFFFN